MKKLIFLWALICVSITGSAQTPLQTIKQDLQKIVDRVDVLIKDAEPKPEEPKPEEPKLDSCKRGPSPERIFNITQNGATVVFDGDGVFGWDYSIYQGGFKKSAGKVTPKSNTEPITFSLEPGDYTLNLTGNTCKSKVYSRSFTVPKPSSDNGGNTGQPNAPPTDKTAQFDFFLGTTGGGFDSGAKYGIKEGHRLDDGRYEESWLDRIEAFKYSWGYGITGISLWIHWDGYEKRPGVYETAALKRVIQYCRERKLKLAIVFLAKRQRNDGFIREEEIVKFSNGVVYVEGPEDQPNVGVWAGYGCDRVNKLMEGAIKDIAATLATYEKASYMSLFGGHTGELINHVKFVKDRWAAGDFSDDYQSRFYKFVNLRGIAKPSRPPMIEGQGIDWPHPNFNDSLGVEFARFQTEALRQQYAFFTSAVKSVSNLPCIYPYAAASNRQLRATANAPIRYIAGSGDGAYGSEGDGVGDLDAKFRVNSVNLGNFPNGISAIEIDPSDTSHERSTTGNDPDYGKANPDYNAVKSTLEKLFDKGVQIAHTAMAFSVQEIRNWEPTLKPLHEKWIGKPYIRPVINSSNTVTVEVTRKYRNSQDLMEGINPHTQYTRYTSNDYWGGVSPYIGVVNPAPDNSKLTGYLDSNLGSYGGNIILDVKRPAGTVYSYSKGSISRDEPKSTMSISKGVTAAAFLAETYDNGTIGLEDKVSKYVPSWKRSDKQNITIRQVVSHTSGIHDETTYDGARTLEEAVDGMANTSLDFTPGTQFRYSTTSYQVLARIAEIVSGKHWEQIFNERIRYKCDMRTAEFNPRGSGPVYGNPANPLAGYGLYASQNDLSNFAAMLRDNGIFNGQRVLSAKAISLLKTNMTNGLGNWGFGFILDGDALVSESAKGLSLCARPGYSYVVMTQSTYEATIGANNGLRELIKSTF